MTCRVPSQFPFCWLCGLPLRVPLCNNYAGSGAADDNSVKRENVRKYLQRYTHYYERWHANEQIRKVAASDLKRWKDSDVSKLGKTQEEVLMQLQFMTEAWEQIVECRHVLKWSYAYGYYMEEDGVKKTEYWQGEAEAGLERLHHCAEKAMGEYLRQRMEDSKEFR